MQRALLGIITALSDHGIDPSGKKFKNSSRYKPFHCKRKEKPAVGHHHVGLTSLDPKENPKHFSEEGEGEHPPNPRK